MRCPRCDAHNPVGADWCSQCFVDLRPQPAGTQPGSTTAEPGSGAGSERAEAREDAEDGEVTGEARSGHGRFRTRDGELEWRCAVCGEWNPLGAGACTVCGTAFGRTLGAGEEQPLADVEPGTVVLASGIVPGAGHILLGRAAQGATRAGFFLFCLVGGYLLLRSAAASGQSLLPAVPLLIGAAVVWAGSIYDGLALTAGQEEVLTPRVLVWLIIGVVGLLLVSFIPGLLRVGQLGEETVRIDQQPDAPAPVETVTVTETPSEQAGPTASPSPEAFPPVTPTADPAATTAP